MGSFVELVDGEKNGWFIGTYVDCIYSTSKAEQRFAILITKGLWYALQVIMDDDYRQYKQPLLKRTTSGEYIIREECPTKDEILKKAYEYKQKLELGSFVEIYKALEPDRARPRVRVMPSDCATNPDKYLQKGDLVQTDFWLNTNHEGIYIGDGQVIHVSGHGDGKAESVARIGQLLGDFVDKPDATIRVVVYRLRFQTRDEIVQRATDCANDRFRSGEYNLLTKNCQHFARLCTINCEKCGDAEELLDFLKFNLLVILILVGALMLTLLLVYIIFK